MSISVQNSSIEVSNLTLEECKNKVKKISIIGGSGSGKVLYRIYCPRSWIFPLFI